jgi:hypothetical protein
LVFVEDEKRLKTWYNFFMKKKLAKNQKKEFYFDDCPICQAMKKAEEEGRSPSLNELKEAFRKAKKKGGIVSFTEDESLN